MKNGLYKSLLLAFLSVGVGFSFLVVHADELDRAGSKIPAGIIVRKNVETNKVEIFKAETLKKVNSKELADAANAAFVNAENKVKSLTEKSELDRDSSVDSWYYYPCSPYSSYYPYYGYGSYPSYYYGYYSYGSYYNYYPYYGYNYGSYYYYYYYNSYGYGNNWWY